MQFVHENYANECFGSKLQEAKVIKPCRTDKNVNFSVKEGFIADKAGIRGYWTFAESAKRISFAPLYQFLSDDQ